MRTLRFVAVIGILVTTLGATLGAREAHSQVNWLTDWRQARDIAQDKQRLILLHFWSDTCPPCKMLERKVFNRNDVARAMHSGYIPVKVNVDSDQQLAKHYRVEKVPTDIIVDASGRVIHQQISPQDPNHYVALLDQIKSHHSVAMLGASTPQAARPSPPATNANTRPTSPVRDLGTTPLNDAATATRGSAFIPQNQVTQAATIPGALDATSNGQPRGGLLTNNSQAQRAPTSGPYANPFAKKTTPNQASAQPQSNAPAISQTNPTNSGYQALTQTPLQSPSSRGGDWRPQGTPVMNNTNGSSMPQLRGNAHQYSQGQVAATMPSHQPTPNRTLGPSARQAMATQPHRPPLPTQTTGAGLEGYCPVTLVEGNTWTRGDARWGANHQGRVYLFSNPENQKRFLATPGKYAPVLSGYDPVRYVDAGTIIEGKRRHGLYYGDLYFLFADERSLQQFQTNPMRYVPPEMLR